MSTANWLASGKNLVVNAIHILEMRSYLRSKRFFAFFFTSLCICALVAILVISFSALERKGADEIGKVLFMFFASSQYAVIFLIFPAYSCTALVGERERQTYELLVTTDLKPWEIVWGKFLSSFSNVFLFLISTLPLVMVSFLFGGITPALIVTTYVILMVIAAIVIAISLALSCFHRSVIRSIMGTYLLMFIIGFPLGMFCFYMLDDYLYRSDILELLQEVPYYSLNGIILYFVGPLFVLASFLSFSFLVATNSLKPDSANCSTAARIWFAVFLLTLVGLFLLVSWHNIYYEYVAKSRSIEIEILVLLAIFSSLAIAVIGIVAMLFASTERPRTSIFVPQKLKEKFRIFRAVPMLLWFLTPGSLNGVCWVLLITSLALVMIFFPISLLFNDFLSASLVFDLKSSRYVSSRGFVTIPFVIVSFLCFIGMLGCRFSFRKGRLMAKRLVLLGIIIFLIALIPLYIPLSWAFNGFFHPSLINLQYLSPTGGYISAWVPLSEDTASWSFNMALLGCRLDTACILAFLGLSALLGMKNLRKYHKFHHEMLAQDQELLQLDQKVATEQHPPNLKSSHEESDA